jgi:hypothetical protein
MSQKIVDFYSVSPDNLKPQDVLVSTITCHISHIDHENSTVFVRVYRCTYPPQMGEGYIPQGISLGRTDQVAIAKTLFPVLLAFDNIEVL